MSFNLGKSLSRDEMKNVKGGNPDTWSHGCAPNGAQPYSYALGCCYDMCHEFGVGDICYREGEGGGKPCRDIMT